MKTCQPPQKGPVPFGLASQRPLAVTYSDELYRTVHPAWVDRLGASSTRVRVQEPIEISLHAMRDALERLR